MSKIKTKSDWHKCSGCKKLHTIELNINQVSKTAKCPHCGKHDIHIVKKINNENKSL